uniref:Uncharacterized protein n=1 Tax=Arundo donax TaxID=35708 RepID=A0A0A9ADM5_ARUDO
MVVERAPHCLCCPSWRRPPHLRNSPAAAAISPSPLSSARSGATAT